MEGCHQCLSSFWDFFQIGFDLQWEPMISYSFGFWFRSGFCFSFFFIVFDLDVFDLLPSSLSGSCWFGFRFVNGAWIFAKGARMLWSSTKSKPVARWRIFMSCGWRRIGKAKLIYHENSTVKTWSIMKTPQSVFCFFFKSGFRVSLNFGFKSLQVWVWFLSQWVLRVDSQRWGMKMVVIVRGSSR